jgi:hypothetical protein
MLLIQLLIATIQHFFFTYENGYIYLKNYIYYTSKHLIMHVEYGLSFNYSSNEHYMFLFLLKNFYTYFKKNATTKCSKYLHHS